MIRLISINPDYLPSLLQYLTPSYIETQLACRTHICINSHLSGLIYRYYVDIKQFPEIKDSLEKREIGYYLKKFKDELNDSVALDIIDSRSLYKCFISRLGKGLCKCVVFKGREVFWL